MKQVIFVTQDGRPISPEERKALLELYDGEVVVKEVRLPEETTDDVGFLMLVAVHRPDVVVSVNASRMSGLRKFLQLSKEEGCETEILGLVMRYGQFRGYNKYSLDDEGVLVVSNVFSRY